jgi:hypothetical protein
LRIEMACFKVHVINVIMNTIPKVVIYFIYFI